jgi:hypothetical protein
MAWLEFWLDNWHVEDSPSGNVTLSGTRTESKTYSDTVSGTVTLSGTRRICTGIPTRCPGR